MVNNLFISVVLISICFALFLSAAYANDKPLMSKSDAYQFEFETIDGQTMPLSQFKGQVMLVVNTASHCGFTGQYKDLQSLYETYKDQGFIIIGVPCNDFGNQEPEGETFIKDFVQNEFGVTFPMTKKYSVSGPDQHPFFAWAIAQNKGGFLFSTPRWNFHKFLIGRDGQLTGSFGSHIGPLSDDMKTAIETALKESVAVAKP